MVEDMWKKMTDGKDNAVLLVWTIEDKGYCVGLPKRASEVWDD